MTPRRRAVRVCGRSEGALAEAQGDGIANGRSSTRWHTDTWSNSIPANRGEQDKAYAEAMATVYDRYPDDSDIAHAVRRRAVPPRAAARARRRTAAASAESRCAERQAHPRGAGSVLLARDPHHPGACHWYVHATEATAKAPAAQACAEFLGKSIPGASHVNHMPSHTFNEVGRWGDSVRANIEAWHSDLKASAGEGFAIYPAHNLHMLVYAASMDGQGAIAMRAGKDFAKLTGGDTMFQLLTLIRFGRFDEVLEVTARPEGGHQRGRVGVRARLRQAAQRPTRCRRGAHLAALNKLAEVSTATTNFGARHPARRLLGVLAGILEGEIARSPATPKPGLPRSNVQSHWTTSSTSTNRSRCRFRRGIGWAPRCSTRGRACRCRTRLPRRSAAAPAQRLGAARTAARAESTGQSDRRCRRRSPGKLEPLGHVDPRVAFLAPTAARTVPSKS